MIRVVDADGLPAEHRDGAWLLDEASAWVIQAPRDARLSVASRALLWSEPHQGFPLRLPFAVGHLALSVTCGDAAALVPLNIRPSSAKLPPELWATMLGELEAWLPAVSVGVHAPRGGSVGLDGAASTRLAEAVLPLLDPFERALRAVVERPQTLARHPVEDVPLHRTRAADRETVAWLVRHPNDAAWLDANRSHELAGQPPDVPQRTVEDTLDHPANRHVAWLCVRVARVLRDGAAGLRAVRDDELNDTSAWCAGRAEALDAAAERVERLRRRTFLGHLQPAPATEAALLVVRDHPTYARAHRLARRILSPRFRHVEGELAAPTRATFDLYELWAFYTVQRAIAGVVDLDWTLTGASHLLCGTGSGARFIGRRGSLTVEVGFNVTFRSYQPSRPGRHSISSERRPDIVVTANDAGRSAWIALDAKYRVSARNVGDALASAHIYHDALRWPESGGRCRAAVLLCPKRVPEAAPWFEPSFRDEHGVGVFEVCPGAGPWGALGQWIAGTLWVGERGTNARAGDPGRDREDP